jgi:hypothetical protein
MEDEGAPLIWLQALETPIELIVLADQSGVIASRRLEPDHADLWLMPAPTPRLVRARPDEQSMQPGLPAIRVAQQWQTLPGSNQRVLHGVLRLVGITEHEAGRREKPGGSRSREGFERLVVAALRRLDEIALHRCSALGYRIDEPFDSTCR